MAAIFKSNPSEDHNSMAATIEGWVRNEYIKRRSFERRWYNNNFFDEGYHFRYVATDTGRVVDLSAIKGSQAPKRNIPKASRQLRGVANLLLAPDYVPVVYPEVINKVNYEGDDGAFNIAREISKTLAKKQGHWLTEEWDRLELKEKLIHMVLLAGKHGVSYLELFPDSIKEEMSAKVFDAFDVYVVGAPDDIWDAPAIIKARPRAVREIQADDNYDKEVTQGLHPDNKYASSEVKEAYKRSKYGKMGGESEPTIIEYEAFIKSYITKENIEELASKYPKIIAGKKIGDMCMRQVFCAGGIVLKDDYVALEQFPFIDLRMEPGDLYQTPLIERFIGANKSLDVLVNRIEKWSNTMAGGSWSVREGEDFKITNDSGGVVYEYTNAPPIQNQIAPLPNAVFNLVQLFEQFIEEQGASTSALGKLPQGVKSGVAIESVKATEFDNLTIPVKMMKQTVKRISEVMFSYAHDYYVTPQKITLLEKGEPSYFDIIGQRGFDLRRELGETLPLDTVVIKKGTRVKIEIESGLGFTIQGKRETAQQLIEYMIKLAQIGVIPLEAVKIVTGEFLRIFQFGGTQEFMEAMDKFIEGGGKSSIIDDPATVEKEIEKIKVGVLEALEAAGELGDAGRQQTIDAVKVGFLEVLEQLQGGSDPMSSGQMGQMGMMDPDGMSVTQ